MASMTFVQLAQRLAQECGVVKQGTNAVPSTCQNQTGELKRLVDWISQAYIEIQELHPDWSWLMNDFSFTTTYQQQLYTPSQVIPSGDWGTWKIDSLRCFTTANNYLDEQILIPVEFDVFRNQYQYGNMRFTYTRPMSFAIDPPTMGLLLGPIPDNTGWTVLGKYFRQPTTLVNDSDVPLMPPKYHMLVVYKAMISYGYYESAPEVLANGQSQYSKMLAQLEIDQIPGFGFGAPLA